MNYIKNLTCNYKNKYSFYRGEDCIKKVCR